MPYSTHERLAVVVKYYRFQVLPVRQLCQSHRVRRFWTISYANTSVSWLVLAEVTGIRHVVYFT